VIELLAKIIKDKSQKHSAALIEFLLVTLFQQFIILPKFHLGKEWRAFIQENQNINCFDLQLH